MRILGQQEQLRFGGNQRMLYLSDVIVWSINRLYMKFHNGKDFSTNVTKRGNRICPIQYRFNGDSREWTAPGCFCLSKLAHQLSHDPTTFWPRTISCIRGLGAGIEPHGRRTRSIVA